MNNSGSITYKADLGLTPFHLGCTAIVQHPNCGICNPLSISREAAKEISAAFYANLKK